MDFIILSALFIGMCFGVGIIFFIKVKIPEWAKKIVEGDYHE